MRSRFHRPGPPPLVAPATSQGPPERTSALDARAVHARNRGVYDTRDVAHYYATHMAPMGLFTAEQAVALRLGDRLRGAVLDVGVGGGRTVPHLHALAGRYLGIDYAAAMVRRCRERFPSVD